MPSFVHRLAGLVILGLTVLEGHCVDFPIPSIKIYNPMQMYEKLRNGNETSLHSRAVPDSTAYNVLIVHGIEVRHTDSAIKNMSDAFAFRNKTNVYQVKWSGIEKVYRLKAVDQYKQLGQKLALAVRRFFNNHKINITTLHVVGFGQDAYITSAMTRNLMNMEVEKVGRVTALNPTTLDLYEVEKEGFSIRTSYANYVEVYHTEDVMYGRRSPQGYVDIYFHRGMTQPGCSSFDSLCSHERAWIYYCRIIRAAEPVFIRRCSQMFQSDSPHLLLYAFSVTAILEYGEYCV